MDWLLKHKAGLKMRYHLHEVLDIGYYTVKNIPWVVHEIEKVENKLHLFLASAQP